MNTRRREYDVVFEADPAEGPDVLDPGATAGDAPAADAELRFDGYDVLADVRVALNPVVLSSTTDPKATA
jgi:hypothetical protein